LPPEVAPLQVMIIPVAQHKEGVLQKANELLARLKKICRVGIDETDQSPGWKFSQYEMKGVPIRLEIGPKDIEKNQCVLVRRDNKEKLFISLDELEQKIPVLLDEITKNLYNKAFQRRQQMTYTAKTLEEIKEIASTKEGFIKASWCGNEQCEIKLKEVADVSSRCMPFDEKIIENNCVCCGKEAKSLVYWGKAY